MIRRSEFFFYKRHTFPVEEHIMEILLKAADLVTQSLVRRAGKDLELVVAASALRLAFILRLHLYLLRRCAYCGCHKFSTQYFSCQCVGQNLAGRLRFEPRQSAPKALDSPLVDRP